MKASAALVCALAAVASVDAWKTIATNDGVRILSSASAVKQNDGGKMTMAADTRPQVTNGGVNFYPYSADIRQYIVTAHNRARAQMVPTSAANMRQVAWDESLAIEAAELVNTCVFEHDTENYAYGQNLMYGGRTISTAVVDSWMDAWVQQEISPSDRAGNGYMDLDHASAVLWANSYLVGCASKMCPNGYLTACNYYTPGNWQGERTYIPGAPCSQCPSQAPYCDATYGKLCTANRATTPTSAPVPVTPAPTRPVPVPTPAKTTTAPSPGQSVPAPTPAATTPRPLPTPSKTQSQADQKATETPAPIWQRPIDITSAPGESETSAPETPAPENAEETPEPTDDTGKWTNVEGSPATKPLVSSVVAAVSAFLLIARAM